MSILSSALSMFTGSPVRKTLGILGGGIAFVATAVGLWEPAERWLALEDFNVYVFHTYAPSDDDTWHTFDQGIKDYLVQYGASLDGAPLPTKDYQIHFLGKTWTDEEELLEQIETVRSDRRALAIVAATNSHDAQVILEALPAEERPLVVLAAATRNDLLQVVEADGSTRAAPRVFRLIAHNELQAERLGTSMMVPSLRCEARREKPVAVAIFREESENSAFSRDLAEQLRGILEETDAGVEVLVDTAVDGLVTVPAELVELDLDYIVYIGSQENSLPLYRQVRRLHASRRGDDCPPKLLLTDAGISGELGDGIPGERSLATFPLAREDLRDRSDTTSFYTLGWDSALLVHEAVMKLLQGASAPLEPESLSFSFSRLDISGKAQDYRFTDGENERGDFHLWGVEDGTWRHLDLHCPSTKDDETAAVSRPPSVDGIGGAPREEPRRQG